MTWHAKLRYGYNLGSTEADDNAKALYDVVSSYGFTYTAAASILGNMQHESGLNPWRWQGDTVSLTASDKGYGLVQFTPAYGYIGGYGVGLQGYAPSTSVDVITGNTSDAIAQSICIAQDTAGKYFIRTWAPSQFKISWNEFKSLDPTELYKGAGAWLYNYESPTEPSSKLAERYNSAAHYYELLSGYTPGPSPVGGTLPIWLIKMIRDKNF